VAEEPVPLRVQTPLLLKPPLLGLTEKVIVPPGVLVVPLSVSVTVAVQVVPLLASTVDGEQLTLVEVVRAVTVTLNEPLFVVCVPSPP
jgi:hypothetical protein